MARPLPFQKPRQTLVGLPSGEHTISLIEWVRRRVKQARLDTKHTVDPVEAEHSGSLEVGSHAHHVARIQRGEHLVPPRNALKRRRASKLPDQRLDHKPFVHQPCWNALALPGCHQVVTAGGHAD